MQLAADGFEVFAEVVPPALCEAALKAIAERTGLSCGDPTSWAEREIPFHQIAVWGHQAIWDIRQHPELHAALADAWGTPELWVTIDTCNFTPPARAGCPPPLGIHWDADPRDPSARWIQGLVALTDAGIDAGGFRCAPTWRDAPERWPNTWTEQPWGVEYRIDPPEDEVVQVPLRQGDLLLWESSLPHGTVANRSTRPRVAQYVSMFPAGSAEEAAVRVADFEAGRFPAAGRWRPGHDVPDPGPPPVLTELGERLLGRRRWS